VDLWGRGGALGLELRQLGRVRGEHLGQHVRESPQPREAVRHLTGRGRPEAGGFRTRLGPIPPAPLTSRMRLKPRGDGAGLAIGEQGQRPPPFKVQSEGARAVTLPQGELVHAEDPWRADRRAGGATDHP
jgi:hypothetical protein